jgi:Flp pilus assembly protein TadD
VKLMFIVAVIAIIVLCTPVFGQMTAEDWTNKGDALLYDQQKYNEAIQAYDKAIEIDPQKADAWYSKGNALKAQSKYDEAIKAYDKTIQLNPNYANAWYNKANTLKAQSKYDEAIKAYDRVIEINPQYVSAWINKGVALDDLGKYDEAVQAYNKAIEIKPQDADAWYNKGRALFNEGKYDETIQAFDKVIELKPDAEVWYNKGVTLKKLGKASESDAAFAKAEELRYSGVSEDSIVGKWINRYDWGCTGSPTQGELNFKGDGTLFDDGNRTGKWTRTGDNIHITWDTGPAVYDGTIQTNTMGGVLSGTPKPPMTGCWSASKV